jgi:hypothetical protein
VPVLYSPEAFGRLTDRAWDEGWVRAAIADIVADADANCRPKLLWRPDEWDGWRSPKPLKTLYVGAAGMAWGLNALRERGHAESRLDLARVVTRALEAWHEKPGVLLGLDQPEPARASLFHGETGILTVLYRLAPSASVADALHDRVLENVANEANEVFWGAPGTMLAARAMERWTGEGRWADAWRASADELWRRRDAEGLWTQRLHGSEARSLGAPHGLVGNVGVLLEGRDSDEPRREALVRDTISLLERYAIRDDGLVTWPGRAGGDAVWGDGETRLQWCGGAPGIAVAAAAYLPEELLLAAAETVWRAGPHADAKGASICHGTAGNGYALLKTFERTGVEVWLERARRFAVHALEQAGRLRERRGRGRYSLFTGDVGTALYAADCLSGVARYPVYDDL